MPRTGSNDKLRNSDVYAIECGMDKSADCADWLHSRAPEHLMG